jgi:hypothetical protein
MDQMTENAPHRGGIEFTETSIGYLSETRRWTMFLAIVGFIFIGLGIIGAIFMSSLLTAFMPSSGIIGTVVILVICLIYLFPLVYLLRFSSLSKVAIASNDKMVLQEAMKNLKSFFKFMGILMIVMLSIYLIAIIVAAIGAAVMAGSNL